MLIDVSVWMYESNVNETFHNADAMLHRNAAFFNPVFQGFVLTTQSTPRWLFEARYDSLVWCVRGVAHNVLISIEI